MRLLLVRHAKAEVRSWSAYPDDDLRPLSETGKTEQHEMSRAMIRMRISFDYLVSSPRLRALQTAKIIAKEYEWASPIERSDLLGDDFTVDGVINWLVQNQDEAKVVCVGHEPDLSELASAMIAGDDSVHIDFKKSAVLAIDFDGNPAVGKGILRYFLRPKQILALAR
jgi:phosphohistidine phosphatase